MTPDAIEIDVHAVKALRTEGEPFLLLDCREPDEHAIARIDGAVLIPMQQVPDRLAEIEAWRDRRIVVHCHHGGRSLRVTRFLRGHGFETVHNMTGGIEAWSLEIDQSVPRY